MVACGSRSERCADSALNLAIPVPDAELAREMVEAAREMIRCNSRATNKGRRFFEFGGLLYCGGCGKKMAYQRCRTTPASRRGGSIRTTNVAGSLDRPFRLGEAPTLQDAATGGGREPGSKPRDERSIGERVCTIGTGIERCQLGMSTGERMLRQQAAILIARGAL